MRSDFSFNYYSTVVRSIELALYAVILCDV